MDRVTGSMPSPTVFDLFKGIALRPKLRSKIALKYFFVLSETVAIFAILSDRVDDEFLWITSVAGQSRRNSTAKSPER